MICPGCAALLNEGVHTCPACGAALTQALLVLPAADAEAGGAPLRRSRDAARLDVRPEAQTGTAPVHLVARESVADLPDFPHGRSAPRLRWILAGVASAVALAGVILYALRPHAVPPAGPQAVPADAARVAPKPLPAAAPAAAGAPAAVAVPADSAMPASAAPAAVAPPADSAKPAPLAPPAASRPKGTAAGAPTARGTHAARPKLAREAAVAAKAPGAPAAKTLDDLLK